MKRFVLALALGCITFLNYAHADTQSTSVQPNAEVFGANKVDGLELPPDQTVSPTEGFVNLQAKCEGEIKWLVISSARVKYIAVPQTNSIIISIPPQGGTITVFAVGLVGSKLTDFAKTNIKVSGNGPQPQPQPSPEPPGGGPLHITFLVDLNSMTPELAQILNSQTLRQRIAAQGNFFRLYDLKSPVISAKKFDGIVQRIGGNAIIVIQKNDGYVLDAQKVPSSEAQVLQLINQYSGGK